MHLPQATALGEREADGGECTERGERPERAHRPLAGAQHREHRGGRRQQRDHDDAVAGGHLGEGVRRQQWEARHHAGRDHGQTKPLATAGERLPGERERRGGEGRGDDGPARADEERGEVRDREPAQRHGEGEGGDTEDAPAEAGRKAG
ncbi:hypothetical protein [Nocardioides convexus]|uniref:hypothetical protein n=1 Tax=Nocardioides convexus TaxID=2712224 RepID=UPI002418B1DD|nr:hypothetical protein [Nocardioides convexus]